MSPRYNQFYIFFNKKVRGIRMALSRS